MSRSMRSSMASIHSLVDSMGDDEFLSASPFNPKNLELRRAQREATIANRTNFQAEFCRIDSMAYRGRGIVEDSDNVAPVACSPPRGRPAQPSNTSNNNSNGAINSSAHDPVNRLGRPPRSSHIMMSDDNKVASASRRRLGNGRDRNPRYNYGPEPTTAAKTTAAAPPVPPPATAMHIPMPPSPSRSATHQRAAQPELHSRDVPVTAPITTATNTARNTVMPAPASPPKKPRSPVNVYAMAPLSPADHATDLYSVTGVASSPSAAARAPHPPLPPRAPAASRAGHRNSLGSSSSDTRRESKEGEADAQSGAAGKPRAPEGHGGVHHPALHGDRRRKVDMVDFIAPLSPAKASPIAQNNSFPSPTLRGVAAANSSTSSQSSAVTLPPLNGQPSSSEGSSSVPRGVQRRNSSPARVRRASAANTLTSTPNGTVAAAATPSPASPPASALPLRSVAARHSSSSDFTAPVLGSGPARKSDSSHSSTIDAAKDSRPPASPSSAGRSSDVGVTPASNRSIKMRPVVVGSGAPGSLRLFGSSASQPSAAPSVTTAISSRSSSAHSSSSASSSSSSSTPVATPSATLRLLTEPKTTPSRRLAAAARVTVTPASTPEKVAFHPPPPPPPPPAPPQWKTTIPTPVPLRTTTARAAPPTQPGLSAWKPTTWSSTEKTSSSPSRDAANENFLNKAKNAQRRRSLLDAGGSHMSDSVRRQYYCLPSTEDTSIPNFAMEVGDLHVKPDSPVAAEKDDAKGAGGDGKNATRGRAPNGVSNNASKVDRHVAPGSAVSAAGSSAPRSPSTTIQSPLRQVCTRRPRVSASPPAVQPAPSSSSSLGALPATRPGAPPSSSAVPQDYFLDIGSPATGGSASSPTWSPQPDRFILPEPSDMDSETEGSEKTMEPLMLDAVRAFNDRFRQTHLKK